MERERRQALSGAAYRREGATFVELLGGQLDEGVLQLIGEGLLLGLRQQVAGAALLVDRCASALRRRGWAGDEELAAELDAAAGRSSCATGLKPLAVDLDELSMVLEAGLGEDGGYIDRASGEVWPAPAVEYVLESQDNAPDFEDEDRWLYVGPEGSDEGYRDMQEFINTVHDPVRADRLAIAVEGRGAFRRFNDTIARWPEEMERWHEFAGERRVGRARQWLADTGYRSQPEATDTATRA